MRISDWSSDVCSSDLVVDRHEQAILQPCRHAASLRPGMPVHVDELGVGTPLPQPAQLHRPQRRFGIRQHERSEEHTSELQSLMRISYAVFCLKKKKRID